MADVGGLTPYARIHLGPKKDSQTCKVLWKRLSDVQSGKQGWSKYIGDDAVMRCGVLHALHRDRHKPLKRRAETEPVAINIHIMCMPRRKYGCFASNGVHVNAEVLCNFLANPFKEQFKVYAVGDYVHSGEVKSGFPCPDGGDEGCEGAGGHMMCVVIDYKRSIVCRNTKGHWRFVVPNRGRSFGAMERSKDGILDVICERHAPGTTIVGFGTTAS